MFDFFKKNLNPVRVNRFRHKYFQQKIRHARIYSRVPKIVPGKTTNISLTEQSLRTKKYLIFFLPLFFVGLILFLQSDYFIVTEIILQPSPKLSGQKVSEWLDLQSQKKYFFLWPENHIIFMSRNRVEGTLKQNSSQILRLSSFKKIWPNKISISIEERIPVAIWSTSNSYYYLSNDLVLSEQLPADYASSTQSFILIRDLASPQAKVGDKLSLGEFKEFYDEVKKEWNNFSTTPIQEIAYRGADSHDAFVKTRKGWTALLDMSTDLKSQLNSLKTVFNEQLKREDQDRLVYVDLRLVSTVYYCFSGEPCEAKKVP